MNAPSQAELWVSFFNAALTGVAANSADGPSEPMSDVSYATGTADRALARFNERWRWDLGQSKYLPISPGGRA